MLRARWRERGKLRRLLRGRGIARFESAGAGVSLFTGLDRIPTRLQNFSPQELLWDRLTTEWSSRSCTTMFACLSIATVVTLSIGIILKTELKG